MAVQHSTAGLSLWVPTFVAAHLFAAFFIIRALSAIAPDTWTRLKRRLLFWRAAEPVGRLPRPKSGDIRKEMKHTGPALLLQWDGVGCAYSTASGVKTVLQGVSGVARPYEMQALLGPSGAGKSTLLDILAGRKSVGRLAGAVRVNGVRRGPSFGRHVSYVPQEDTFLPTMTVGETCALHAALTLPRGTPRAAMAARSEEVLAAMGMLHAHDTLVGGVLPGGLTLRGLSGGERKRVSIATGILAAPSIIFLDEPTSGLDSASALSVVDHLRSRARDSGLTIVASIHQPRAAVWALFDACSLLSGGLLMYAGSCRGAVPWFESIGCGPWQSGVHGTAADFVMDLINIGFDEKPLMGEGATINTREELEAAAAKFAAHYEEAAARAKAECGGSHGADDTETGGLDTAPPALSRAMSADADADADGAVRLASAASSAGGIRGVRRRPSWWSTFRALFWREMLGAIRNPADVAGRMLLFAYIGAVCGVVFWRAGDQGGLESVRNRINVLFIMGMQLLLMPYVYMSLYAADKRHYTADISARLYSPSPYYAAKSLASFPFMLLNVMVCTFTAYGMTGLRASPGAVAVVGAASALLYLVAQQLHSLATIVTPNEDTSFLLTIVWSAFNIYFSNFIMRFGDMSVRWLPPMRFVSALYFTFSALIKAEFEGTTYPCTGGLLRPDMLTMMRNMLPATPVLRSSAVASTFSTPGPQCVIAAQAVVEYFGATSPVWVYLLSLAGYLALMHVLTFLGLLLLARKERR